MPRKPNYDFERRERERARAARKAAKAEAKRIRKPVDAAETVTNAGRTTVLNAGLKPESD
ncbi:MAG: hypothetical protein JSU82_07070 [Rhodospirillales bacterium]|nr:MAG: hypothetical protein JSU82_07070 [Rhodospirillales bacterium]